MLTDADIQQEIKRFLQCHVCKAKLREEAQGFQQLIPNAIQYGWAKLDNKIYCKGCKERHAK